MKLEENILICNLIDTYGSLLSEKQQTLLKLYYFDDMSLGEIADNEKITRQAVLDAIKNGIKKLEYYESKIKMLELKEKLKNCCLANDVKSQLKMIMEEI